MNGIILIKGKAKKDNQFLYACHVKAQLEIKPGATLLILSDTFYRVIKSDSGKLKGVLINWKDEAALKAALNFKSNGQLSVVKNNNKTPFHWKTLKHQTIHSALAEVESDLVGSQYLFESSQATPINLDQVATSALNLFFLGKGTDLVVLKSILPESVIDEQIESNSRASEVEWECNFECLWLGESTPFATKTSRFTLDIDLFTEYQIRGLNQDEYEVDDINTEVIHVFINGDLCTIEITDEIIKVISEMDPDEIGSLINKNCPEFIKVN